MILLSSNDPFGNKAWQEFLNQTLFLDEHGLGVEDVWRALELKKTNDAEAVSARDKEYRANRIKALSCPGCGYPLQLLAVNDSPGTQTGDDSKSMWLCRNCLYERFSTQTIEEEYKSSTNSFNE